MFVTSDATANSYATELSRQRNLQGRLMWFDAEANIWALSTRKGVADTIQNCKAANINTIIVDVKPLSGMVLYKSKIAPRLTQFGGKPYPANYDLLRTVVEEGHKVGLKVHAAINVFSEGTLNKPGGPAHKHPDWQCVQYEMRRVVKADDGTDLKMTCSNAPYAEGQVCLYGQNSEAARDLPPNTTYVRVTHDGYPIAYGTATGRARLAAPDGGGYLLVANGEAGEWLKKMAESKTRFYLEGNGMMTKVSKVENVHNAMFVNPSNPAVRNYELGIVKEICQNYAVDGIVLDRMRYPNIYTDFSDITRKAFEKNIGREVRNWPDDVFSRDPVPGDDIIRGPLFKDWIKFRAQTIHDFLCDVRNIVKSTRRNAMLGVYVGSWYPLYYDVGVNWGSPNHKADYEWWPDGYEATGYADHVDYLCAGCYYTYPTRQDAIQHSEEEWKSVEAAAQECIKAVNDATFVYGSLYLYQYQGSPQRFTEAINQCLDKTQGCMFFDLVYVRKYGWWDTLQNRFYNPAKAPHEVPGLLDQIRK